MVASKKNEPIIEVKHLSKKYEIGVDRTYKTLSGSLTSLVKNPLKTLKDSCKQNNNFWALKDVNFEIEKGEVVGIIGRNGAGKSTLLKVLSRITYPTEGEVRMHGRIGSLLEVGTGFHPELSGRENIYFNGAILGMKKREIDDKFDEIVKFSGVEKFLDTPVKRYSSGMQVRLAFSVAAHLEPEILVVDEVLAVGDMDFQKKCLGKMEDISKGEGRTVLFVSHNMAAIESLCSRTIVLEKGKNIFDGETREAVSHYLDTSKQLAKLSAIDRVDREGNGKLKIIDIIVGVENNVECGYWQTGLDCVIQFKYKSNTIITNVNFGFSFHTLNGSKLFSVNTTVLKKNIDLHNNKGVITCKIKKFPVNPGQYYITYNVYSDTNDLFDKLENAMLVTVEDGDFYGTGILWGGYSTISTEYSFYTN